MKLYDDVEPSSLPFSSVIILFCTLIVMMIALPASALFYQ